MRHLVYLFFFIKVLPGFSQQNFINVPSMEVTKSKKIFFQQQVNFNELIQSNTTLDLGLGKGTEVGLNVLGLNFTDKQKTFFENDTNDRDPYNPLVLLNLLKTLDLSKKVSLGIGAQFGLNFDFGRKNSRAGLLYCNLRYTDLFIENSSIIAGSYYNSLHYGGEGNRFGYWMGIEMPLTPSVHLIAESVLGNNALCYSSAGLTYYLKKRYVFTLGAQIPNTKKNAYALVFELTILPKGT